VGKCRKRRFSCCFCPSLSGKRHDVFEIDKRFEAIFSRLQKLGIAVAGL